ncbi:hypothetical protein ITP53_33450 [Nonomuraea sp. K274]|uniref:Lipoprotein n=1 Tax=Nonomuraea cypriaca TaxID=1187855 RepID=A0A931F1I7_9ACTN|nr:hypothetical protein [Nonomuraea cypriaca]MBF8190535.1 hypothetical protein [Nonomuraea cypriaca]
MKCLPPALSIVLLLTGCGAGRGSSQPPVTPPSGVSVSLAQWRSDEAAHRLQVAVRNTSETSVHFTDIQLVTPSFTTLPPRGADASIGRTDRTDLPIPYGAANCTPGRLPEVRPATVVAHVSTGSEPPRRVVFDVPHPDPLLTRLLRDECSEYLIKQTVSIEFGPEWRLSGKAMRGDLMITRRGAGTVTVTGIGSTTHYIATSDHHPLGVLKAAEQRMEAPVELTPGNCTPHAFAEAKKAFLFPVRASVDGGEERVIIVVPPKPQQDRLIAYALEACGLGGN